MPVEISSTTGGVSISGGGSGGGRIDLEGGAAATVYLLGQNIDGGSASAVYSPSQILDGGGI